MKNEKRKKLSGKISKRQGIEKKMEKKEGKVT